MVVPNEPPEIQRIMKTAKYCAMVRVEPEHRGTEIIATCSSVKKQLFLTQSYIPVSYCFFVFACFVFSFYGIFLQPQVILLFDAWV